MISTNYMGCCGLREITNLQNLFKPMHDKWSAERALVQLLWNAKIYFSAAEYTDGRSRSTYFARDLSYAQQGGHWIFSDAHEGGPKGFRYGKAFTKYILKNKLGTITATKQTPNPTYVPNLSEYSPEENFERLGRNNHHQITCYIWTVDHQALAKWAEKHVPNPWYEGAYGKINHGEYVNRLHQYWLGLISFNELMSHKRKVEAKPEGKEEPKPGRDRTATQVEADLANMLEELRPTGTAMGRPPQRVRLTPVSEV